MSDDEGRRGLPDAPDDEATDELDRPDLSELLIDEEIANDCRGDKAADPVPPPRPHDNHHEH